MITIELVAKVVSGRIINSDLGRMTTGALFFDSRTPIPDGIFLALKGEKSDGHDFAHDAGGAFSFVEREVDGPAVIVDDVLAAASIWAGHYRSLLSQLTVIGITGSQGKTTTKDMLSHMLRNVSGDPKAVVAPSGSYNNDLGLPVVLTSCTESTRYCVAEMGARHTGDILRLAKIARPRIGVVLKVGTAHLGEFGSREAIAQTKSELVSAVERDGVAILGTYDEFTPKMAQLRSDLKVITFGERGELCVYSRGEGCGIGGVEFSMVTPHGREIVELRVAGMHNVANALATAAVGYELGIPENEIASSLSTFEPSSRWRMELQEIAGVTVVNDAYNANPESMRAALETTRLLAQEKGGRTFAFLGTMNELGEASDAMHRQVRDSALELGIDYLIAVAESRYDGPTSSESEIIVVDSIAEAETHFASIEPGDCVLFKASRSVGLERLAEAFIELLKRREGSDDMRGRST